MGERSPYNPSNFNFQWTPHCADADSIILLISWGEYNAIICNQDTLCACCIVNVAALHLLVQRGPISPFHYPGLIIETLNVSYVIWCCVWVKNLPHSNKKRTELRIDSMLCFFRITPIRKNKLSPLHKSNKSGTNVYQYKQNVTEYVSAWSA